MDDHDPHCFMRGAHPCPVCAAINAVRSEEKQTATEIWKHNMPLVERRNFLDGYRLGLASGELPERFR